MNWTGDVATIDDVDNSLTTITINSDCDIVANFEILPPVGLATRTLPITVLPGTQCVVFISVAGCGAMGQIVETIPFGFTYVATDFDGSVSQSGQMLTFTFMGDSKDFSYVLLSPITQGAHTFLGIVAGDDLITYSVGGDTILNVNIWSPWNYDINHDMVITKPEALNAVVDFFDTLITKQQALEVIVLFFS